MSRVKDLPSKSQLYDEYLELLEDYEELLEEIWGARLRVWGDIHQLSIERIRKLRRYEDE